MKALSILISWLIAQSCCEVNKVVDLSHWNRVDFSLAKEDGIVAAIHKATQGKAYVDPFYQRRRLEAEEAGLLWGAYHFGTGSASGTLQADHFLETVGNHSKVLLVLDMEPNGNHTMRLEQAEQFVLRILEVTHRHPLVYGSAYFLSQYLGKSAVLRRCKLWVAHYTVAQRPRLPAGADSWLFWQYTDGSRGGTPRSVRGIGPCDRDRFAGCERQLIDNWPAF